MIKPSFPHPWHTPRRAPTADRRTVWRLLGSLAAGAVAIAVVAIPGVPVPAAVGVIGLAAAVIVPLLRSSRVRPSQPVTGPLPGEVTQFLPAIRPTRPDTDLTALASVVGVYGRHSDDRPELDAAATRALRAVRP